MSSDTPITIVSDQQRSRAIKRILFFIALTAIAFITTCTGGNFLFVYITTSDSASQTEQFLTAIEEGNIGNAYSITSSAFKEAQSQQAFSEMIAGVSIVSHEMIPWQNRTLDHNGRNSYPGKLVTSRGRTIPFLLEMMEEQGRWKILSLTGPGRTGVGPGTWFQQVPFETEMMSLVTGTMLNFEKAIHDKNLLSFYQTMWTARTEISYWLFELAYQKFIDDQIDLSAVRTSKPQFVDRPKLDRTSSGTLLVVNGNFDTTDGTLPFTFRYIYDHPKWMLHNINVGYPGDPDFVLGR